MAVKYYDEAVYNKIHNWFPEDSKMTILKVDDTLENFRIRADKGNDKPIELPFINISRDKSFEILRLGRTPLSCSGRIVLKGSEKAIPLNAIPISLSYQIDIYTQRYSEADVYLREIIFNLINHPRLTINVPYNDINFKHYGTVRLLADVQDNSDIPERLFKTQFTRWTLNITIDDAYLFSAPATTIPTIETLGLDIDREDGGEIIVDDSSLVIDNR